MKFCVQHRAKGLHNERTHAAQSLGQSIRAKQHHRTRFCFAERRANTATMRANEIHLQGSHLLRRNAHRRELAKSRVNSVSGLSRRDEVLHHCAGAIHPLDCSRRKADGVAVQRHEIELVECQFIAVQYDVVGSIRGNGHAPLRSGCGATTDLKMC